MPWRSCCAPILILAVATDSTSPVPRIGAADASLWAGVELSLWPLRLASTVSAAESDGRARRGEDGVGSDVEGGAAATAGAPDTLLGVTLATSDSQIRYLTGSPAAPSDVRRSGVDPGETRPPPRSERNGAGFGRA